MILLVTPTAELFGGTERLLETLLRGLGEDSKIAVYFLKDGPLVEVAREQGVPHRVDNRRPLRQVVASLRLIGRIRSFARSIRAETIFGWTEFAQFYAAPAAIGIAKSVWWQQGAVASWKARIHRRLPYAYVIPNSCYIRDQLIDHHLRPSESPLYPVLSATRFLNRSGVSKDQLREATGLPKNRFIVGSVGRLQTWKGFDTFVDALAQVRGARQDVLGVIVGGRHDLEADYEQLLIDRIEQRGLSDHLLLVGNQHNVADWMQAMDVFVHTSHGEPFGMVVPEAMSLELPVIASIPGGPAEVIEHQRNGLLVPSGDGEALAAAIQRYRDDEQLRDRCAAAAKELPEQFTSNGFVERLLSALGGSREACETPNLNRAAADIV